MVIIQTQVENKLPKDFILHSCIIYAI